MQQNSWGRSSDGSTGFHAAATQRPDANALHPANVEDFGVAEGFARGHRGIHVPEPVVALSSGTNSSAIAAESALRESQCEHCCKHRQAAGIVGQGALTTGLKVRASVYHIEIELWKLQSRSRKKAVA